MKKDRIIYSHLSKKELDYLKEFYVEEKVKNMNEKDLISFAQEIIRHQVVDVIGKEEEMEAWREMELFFSENFTKIIEEIKIKFKETNNPVLETSDQDKRIELLETNKSANEKTDMWED